MTHADKVAARTADERLPWCRSRQASRRGPLSRTQGARPLEQVGLSPRVGGDNSEQVIFETGAKMVENEASREEDDECAYGPLTWHSNLILLKRTSVAASSLPSPPPRAPRGAPPSPPPQPAAPADVWNGIMRSARTVRHASLAWRARVPANAEVDSAPANAEADAAPAPRPRGRQQRASRPVLLQLLFGKEPTDGPALGRPDAPDVAPDGPDAAPDSPARSRRTTARTWRLREQPMTGSMAWLEPFRFAKRLPVKRSNFRSNSTMSSTTLKPEQLDYVIDDPAWMHRLHL
jgi:hypothetical protein